MKKILLALALILSVTASYAQPKTVADAKKLVDKAVAASQDAKKAAKVATWIDLAKAYIGAFDQPAVNLIPGTPRTEVKVLLGKQQVLGTDQKKVGGTNYTVDHYADKDLYYNEAGVLEFYVVTKPAVEGDLLGNAEKALAKAVALDTKGAKAKDITALYEDIHKKLTDEALSNYFAGIYDKSSQLFEQSLSSYDNPFMKKIDTVNTYHAGLVSGMAGNNDKAVKYYKKCIDLGHYADGNVFSNLSNIYLQAKDTASALAALEDGFAKYPQSQGVLIGLINMYRESGADTQKLFDLLHAAQANEPNNASLYYVEGDIYKKLGDIENAEKLFRKSTEIDPKYVYGILSVGILYYEHAVEIQEKANNEFDDAKYAALVKEFEQSLENAVEPFEQSFKMTDDKEIQNAVAEYLKNIYFRFRTKSDDYQQKYEFYNNFLKN
ncbi:MAG: tetratricopeptide repeat protein [Bacteroidales bacterium]|nr:tetratricopeptide repeat protein [Bacteroidales bacterium]